jgi:hypothetical protein
MRDRVTFVAEGGGEGKMKRYKTCKISVITTQA